ncbi:MAG: glycosyltransferase family 4 protein, partial [Gemmatimonadetes bacterium]|nr:glycosyltransferase family 4 protein [Gemmatimonadota bacterium]
VRDRGLEGQVRLLGPQPDVSVRELMKNADVFALPCRVASDGNRDALPTVLLEALATGLPCVSTPVVGIPEILDNGRAGILVSPDAPAELAEALTRLQQDMDLRQNLSVAGRKREEDRYDVQRNVATLRAFMVPDTRDESATDDARTSVEAAS